jgi:hypothetical protein
LYFLIFSPFFLHVSCPSRATFKIKGSGLPFKDYLQDQGIRLTLQGLQDQGIRPVLQGLPSRSRDKVRRKEAVVMLF